MDKGLIVGVGASLVLMSMMLFLSLNREIVIQPKAAPPEALHVATLSDLNGRPGVGDEAVVLQYAVRLPQSDWVVVVRPLSQSEVDAYQIQAIAPQLIAWQLLAAAIVSPPTDELDVASLPADLVRYLEGKINDLSGFEVFRWQTTPLR